MEDVKHEGGSIILLRCFGGATEDIGKEKVRHVRSSDIYR